MSSSVEERDYKLLKDIAKIRMTVYKDYWVGTPGRTIVEAAAQVMKELNTSAGIKMIMTQLREYVHDEEKLEMLRSNMTDQFLKNVYAKLEIRCRQSLAGNVKLFEAKHQKRIKAEYESAIKRAANAIIAAQTNLYSEGEDIVLPGSVLTNVNGNIEEASRLIRQQLEAAGATIPDITIRLERFKSVTEDTPVIEHLEKICYYKDWVYDRYQSQGVLLAKIKA